MVSKHDYTITVHEMQYDDVRLIVDYWMGSDETHLRGMGADIKKMPSRVQFTEMLSSQIKTTIKNKKSYALIWELNGQPIGHTNVNDIEFGNLAKMHLHIWKPKKRRKGMGTQLIKASLPFYFENLKLKKLLCEPYALNPAPNRTLEKVGFNFIKKYETIPGSLNFLQYVNRWEMTKKKFLNSESKF